MFLAFRVSQILFFSLTNKYDELVGGHACTFIALKIVCILSILTMILMFKKVYNQKLIKKEKACILLLILAALTIPCTSDL